MRCGLVSHFQIPSDRELRDYYATAYRREYHAEVAPSARRVIRAWTLGHRRLHELRPYLRPEDRVFEIGAGIGCTVKAFQLAGYQAAGIEPGKGFQEFSRKRLHSGIENATLADVPRRPAYDFVLLIHVIEHFRSPAAALRHIHAIIKPKGRLYVECPNLGAPHAAPGRIFHFAHVHNFTRLTLAMLAEACGFRVMRHLSGQRDRNLKMLLQRTSGGRLQVHPESYRQTIAALLRYNTLTYHLRPRYWAERVVTVLEHLSQRVLATRRLERIVDLCARYEQSQQAPDVVKYPTCSHQLRKAA